MSKHKTDNISKLDIPDLDDINLKDFDGYESSLVLSDPKVVRDVLLQHFVRGEHETFFEILALYMNYVGKTRISQETKIPERTIYNFLNGQHKTSSDNVFKLMKFISEEVDKKSA